MTKKKTKKVLVAMSGGVDSTVAAHLMKEQGYEVIGVFLKCWSDTKDISGQCIWVGEKESARRACMKLGIPLITIDAEKEYKKYVVEDMFKDYKRGITPNPDVLCNEIVKFPFLLKTAKRIKADAIVTGHFARVRKARSPKQAPPFRNSRTKKRNSPSRKKVSKQRFELLRAKDEMKDQSYFLYRLKEKDLNKLKFPIGEYTKKEVRDLARKHGYKNHDKKSTVGICFIGKIPMKEFLQTKIKPKKGPIVDPEGNVLGEHDGVAYYTIGQRIGPRNDIHIKKNDKDKQNISRWYVAEKKIKSNKLIVAPAKHQLLYKKNIIIRHFHTITKDKKELIKKITKKPMRVHARIRHVGELIQSKLTYDKEKKRIEITLNKKLDGVSKGQAIVLYKGKTVLGGGIISS